MPSRAESGKSVSSAQSASRLWWFSVVKAGPPLADARIRMTPKKTLREVDMLKMKTARDESPAVFECFQW